jgi:hypothetical protein
MGRLWALLEPILLVAFGLDLLLLLHDGSSFGSRRNRAVFETNWSAPALMMAASERRPRGVIFGRPLKLTAQQRKEAIQRLAEGLSADLARSHGVSQATITAWQSPALSN